MKKNILCLMMVLLLSVILVGCSNNIDYEENLDNFFTTIHDYERFPETVDENYVVESRRNNLEEFMTPEYYEVVLDKDFWDIGNYIMDLHAAQTEEIKDLTVSIKEATPKDDDPNMMDVTAEVSYIAVKEDEAYDIMYTFHLSCDTESGRIADIREIVKNYENIIE